MSQEERGAMEDPNLESSAAELPLSETDAEMTDADTTPNEVTDAISAAEAVSEAETAPESAEETKTDEEIWAAETAEVPVAVSEKPDEIAETTDASTIAEAADEDEGAESGEESTATAEPPVAESEPEDDTRPQRGNVYDGVIVRTTPTAVFVRLESGIEGIIPGRELELMTRKMLESLKVDAEVAVYVVNPRNHRGQVVLSINHALEELDWRKAEEYAKSRQTYDAKIGGYNRGGLIVRFGRLRGFVPQSQIGDMRLRQMKGETPEERYGSMVNQTISIKVMEVDRSRNRLILSERAAMREIRQRQKKELIGELKVGEIRQGIVVSLENFGVFVDIGGAEGLVHMSELTWKHVNHPRQFLSVGQEVEAEVISIDPDNNRIGLSMKRLEEDPWDQIATAYSPGQLVQGIVTKLTRFGAFARLVDAPEVEGLIHISELSDQRVQHPKEVVKRNDKLTLRVVKIDVKDRRLGLSLKAVNSDEYLDMDWDLALQGNHSDTLTEEPVSEEAPVAELVSEEIPAEETASEEAPVAEPVSEEAPAEEPISDEEPTESDGTE